MPKEYHELRKALCQHVQEQVNLLSCFSSFEGYEIELQPISARQTQIRAKPLDPVLGSGVRYFTVTVSEAI
jgi:hypothetical protein